MHPESFQSRNQEYQTLFLPYPSPRCWLWLVAKVFLQSEFQIEFDCHWCTGIMQGFYFKKWNSSIFNVSSAADGTIVFFSQGDASRSVR